MFHEVDGGVSDWALNEMLVLKYALHKPDPNISQT
jgi:hypothetical protein